MSELHQITLHELPFRSLLFENGALRALLKHHGSRYPAGVFSPMLLSINVFLITLDCRERSKQWHFSEVCYAVLLQS